MTYISLSQKIRNANILNYQKIFTNLKIISILITILLILIYFKTIAVDSFIASYVDSYIKKSHYWERNSMSKVNHLIDEDERYFAHSGRIKYYPLVIDHGYGATLIDIDGKSYIDLLASASSQNVGHAPKPVVEAIKNQTEIYSLYTSIYVS